MGNRGVKPKPKAPATRLPAKGKPGRPRRTPQHIEDPVGLCDTYHVEDIIAECMAKNDKGNSEKQWLVQWKGFPDSAQTWEPLENLSGCEAFIVRFNEEREANERADLEKRQGTRDAQDEERQKKQKSESGTALLDSATLAPLQAQTGRRTSVVWTAFTEGGEDPGFARCVLHRGNGVCSIGIKHCSGTTNLRAHLMAHHEEWFIQETEKNCDMQDKLVANGTGAIEIQTTPKWTAQKIHSSNRKRSYWLCRRKRAPHLVTDEEVKDFCDEISCSKYQTTPEVRAARANLRTALEDRFIKALPDHVFEQYSIATLLDPPLKSFRFLSQGERDTAVEAFRAQWTQKWQPQHAERPQPKPAAQKKIGLSALLQDELEEAAGRRVHVPDLQPDDELSAYMALPVESMQTNVIEWWRRHRTVFPNLSRMARQYLATPATSAGVEWLFSAAGLTFGDLAHAMKRKRSVAGCSPHTTTRTLCIVILKRAYLLCRF